MYIDPAKHAAITGAPVAISVEPGSPFQAFNGALTGAMLQVIPQRLVIQSWRSIKFSAGDPDSTLILAFTPERAGGRIDLVHLDVPAHDYQSVVGLGDALLGPMAALSRRLTAIAGGIGRKRCALAG